MTARIYTRAGDGGETGLIGGKRVSKADRRIDALGTLDETNAALGFVLSLAIEIDRLQAPLASAQRDLFEAGAVVANLTLANDSSTEASAHFAGATERLERSIDLFEAELAPLTNFILPGGSRLGAGLHWARTVCRRAERSLVALDGDRHPAQRSVIVYLNRLSDALFVWARWANHSAGEPEAIWRPSAGEEEGKEAR